MLQIQTLLCSLAGVNGNGSIGSSGAVTEYKQICPWGKEKRCPCWLPVFLVLVAPGFTVVFHDDA